MCNSLDAWMKDPAHSRKITRDGISVPVRLIELRSGSTDQSTTGIQGHAKAILRGGLCHYGRLISFSEWDRIDTFSNAQACYFESFWHLHALEQGQLHPDDRDNPIRNEGSRKDQADLAVHPCDC